MRIFLVWLVCFCATIALIYAQDAPTYGAIYGTVLSLRQDVIGDAQIEVMTGPSRIGSVAKSRGPDAVTYDGGFFLPRLLPGTYSIKVSHKKYLPQTYEGIKVEAGKGMRVIAELQSKEDITGSISGSLTVRGVSLKGLVVGYLKDGGKKPEVTVTLKEDGKFSFTEVMPGTYLITLTKNREEVYRSKPIKVSKKKKTRHTIRLDPKKLLEKPGWITGKVTGPDRKPVSNASITTLKMPQGQRKVTVKSNKEGKFEIKNLRPGVYELKASRGGVGENTKKVYVRSNRGSRANFTLRQK